MPVFKLFFLVIVDFDIINYVFQIFKTVIIIKLCSKRCYNK